MSVRRHPTRKFQVQLETGFRVSALESRVKGLGFQL
jgi:hypothetical protein